MRSVIAAVVALAGAGFAPVLLATQTESKVVPPAEAKAIQPKKAEPRSPATPPKDTPPKPPSEIKLKVGDKAPAIAADVWVKGPEVSTFEPTRVYVVEFWATWCPECRKAMPILARLARDHKDQLTVISVASSERKPKGDQDERLAGVRSFVQAHDETMPQSVIFDGSRSMATNWIVAAGRIYIPCVFIVDNKGQIAWIGDPRGKEFSDALAKSLKALPKPEAKQPEATTAKPTPAKGKKGS